MLGRDAPNHDRTAVEALRTTPLSRLADAARATSPRLRVLAYAIVLAATGLAFLTSTPGLTTVPENFWNIPLAALILAFVLAEATALHVEIRKESHSLSLSGIPLLLGLVSTSPLQLAIGYVAGAAIAMKVFRRSDLLKTTWNCSLFFAEASVAAFIVRSTLGPEGPERFLEWLAPLAAVLVAELMSLLAVPIVIMAVDVKFRPNLFSDVGQSQILAALASTFTVAAASSAMDDPWMLVYGLVPFAGVGFLLLAHGRLGQRFSDLQQLHRFTRALTHERGSRTIDTGLVELVQILRARTAHVLVLGDGDDARPIGRALLDDTLGDVDPEPLVRAVMPFVENSGVTRLSFYDPRSAVRAACSKFGARELLVVPILGEVSRNGVLVVADRLGMHANFTPEEQRLFGSLAGTLAARLANDYLVEQLEVQAQHDALTGLANRLSFEVALTSELSVGEREGVVVMMDLNRFKEINDSLGHDMGDKLLVEMARRLRTAMRSSDLVARLGGDEFAIMLAQRSEHDDLVERVKTIHDDLVAPVEIDGITFEIGASLGLSRWPAHGTDSSTLLRRADTAMYHAKRNQLGVVSYEAELDADEPRRLDLYLSVRSALEKRDLSVVFQPKASIIDGRITGVETLARWIHPQHGSVSPTEFVPLIDQAGLTGKLTRFVLTEAAAAAKSLRDDGIEFTFSVNLTPRDLLDPTLPDDIATILADAGLPAGALGMEITENAMVVDFDTSINVLNRIRDLGIPVAIDDFGTGYASLQHLHRLPVDQLKIDRSFISRLVDDGSASPIVQASVSLGRDLGMTTVAEGVEDDFTLRMVSGLGCQEIQGYLLSRPIPLGDLRRWLDRWDPERLLDRLLDDSMNPIDAVQSPRGPLRAPSPLPH